MKIKLLLSVLILYRSNFHNLHWNSKGKSFDRIHVQITDDYMGLMDKYIDIVGEMITRSPFEVGELEKIEFVETFYKLLGE